MPDGKRSVLCEELAHAASPGFLSVGRAGIPAVIVQIISAVLFQNAVMPRSALLPVPCDKRAILPIVGVFFKIDFGQIRFRRAGARISDIIIRTFITVSRVGDVNRKPFYFIVNPKIKK